MKRMDSYKELIVTYNGNVIEVYEDPRYVLRLRKDRSKEGKITVELNSTIIGKMSMDIYPELLREILDNLERID